MLSQKLRTQRKCFKGDLAKRADRHVGRPVAQLRPSEKAPLTAVASAALSVLLAGSAMAAEPATIEVFANKCAGCHMNGGNVVAAGATLFPADLKRNGVDSPEALYKLIYSGKGKMPGFGKDCAPKGACTFGKRLSDDEIQGLTEYVLEKAAVGWAN